MGQVIIRNLDDGVLDSLRAQAAAHGMSLEQELRDVLTAAVRRSGALAEDLARIRALTPRSDNRPPILAEELVRQGRDER
jgi:antitoxin FitA